MWGLLGPFYLKGTMMEIKLILGDKEKTFVAGQPKGRVIREALSVTEKIDMTNIHGEDLDLLIDFVVNVFGGQFTRDDVYDGLYAQDLFKELMRVIGEVTGGTAKKIEEKNAKAE